MFRKLTTNLVDAQLAAAPPHLAAELAHMGSAAPIKVLGLDVLFSAVPSSFMFLLERLQAAGAVPASKQ